MSITETNLDHLYGSIVDRPRRRDPRLSIVILLLGFALVAAAVVPLIGASSTGAAASSDQADVLLGP